MGPVRHLSSKKNITYAVNSLTWLARRIQIGYEPFQVFPNRFLVPAFLLSSIVNEDEMGMISVQLSLVGTGSIGRYDVVDRPVPETLPWICGWMLKQLYVSLKI